VDTPLTKPKVKKSPLQEAVPFIIGGAAVLGLALLAYQVMHRPAGGQLSVPAPTSRSILPPLGVAAPQGSAIMPPSALTGPTPGNTRTLILDSYAPGAGNSIPAAVAP
jgi:hypothetical protein